MSTNNQASFKCYNCKKDIPVFGSFRVTRTEECPYCSRSMHCCKMCKFYDVRVYNECLETNADRVVDKEKANFCDYFTLTDGGSGGPSVDELVNLADALFKK